MRRPRKLNGIHYGDGVTATLAAGMFILSFSGWAQAAPGTAIDSQLQYAAAKKSMQAGDVATAIIELKNVIRSDPANSSARYDLALLYLESGNPAAALPELEAARNRGYDAAQLQLPLAQSYLALGRFRDVLTQIDTRDLTGNARAAVLAIQARASMGLNDFDKARPLLDEARALEPENMRVLIATAMMLSAEGKLSEAEAVLGKEEIDEERLDVLLLRGKLRQQQNDLDGALKYFNIAAAKYPQVSGIRIERASVNVARNSMAAADEDIAWVLNKEPQHPLALYLRAYSLARSQKYREASQTLLAVPALLDHYPPASYLLAATSLEEGHHEVALDYSRRYLRAAPNSISGNRLLALVHQRMKMPTKAVEVLEPLALRYPDDNALKLQLAGALLEAGRSAEAISLFQQGIAADPSNTEAQLALAIGQLRAGDTDHDVASIEKVVRENPGSFQAGTLLVLTQLQTSQFDKALITATAIAKANPSEAAAHNLLGTVYLSAHDVPNARTAFMAALQRNGDYIPAILNLARLEEKNGNRPAAQKGYQKAVAIEPTSLIAYEGLANLALGEGRVTDAAAYLKQAIAQDGAAAKPRLQLIDMLLLGKKAPQALIEARDFYTAAPLSPEALDALARSQIANGDFAGGLSSYQRLATQNPDTAEAQRRLGRAYMSALANGAGRESQYLDQARVAFDKAMTLAPENLIAVSDRIEFERRANGTDGAFALAQSYVTAQPESAVRLIALGDIHMAEGRIPAATQAYRQAWQKSQSNLSALRLYRGLKQEGKGDEGLKILKEWVETHPTDYDARFLIASDDILAGRTDAAIAGMESLLAVSPDNPVLLNNLAWLYSQRDSSKAIALAERAYALAPQSPDVLDTLGWLRVTNADVAKGIPLLRKAHEAAPTRGDIGFHYAFALEKSNKSADAKIVLEKILADEPDFVERADAQALFNKLAMARAVD